MPELLSNAILTLKTVHVSNIFSRLRSDGHGIPGEHYTGVSPLLHEHVIINGMYDFAYRRRRTALVQ